MKSVQNSIQVRSINQVLIAILPTCAFLFLCIALPGCSKNKQEGEERNGSSNAGASLGLFEQGGEYGYKDASGTIVIKPQFVEAGDFSWGLARIKPDSKRGWGYIDGSGREVLPPQYKAAGDFVDGIAVVLSRGQFVYIGPDGSSLGLFEEEHPRKPLSAGDTLYVIHPNGLIMRSSGDLNAAPVSQVRPDDAVVYACDPQAARSESLDGFRGHWLLVRHQRQSGYLFDLYVSRYSRVLEHSPVECYRLIGSSLSNEGFSTYTLTKFATGGRRVVREGPNWTESREVVPDATVDQVMARIKLSPNGDIGSLVLAFNGTSRTYTTEKGDTVAVTVRRDAGGFLQNVTMSKRNEEATFDVTIGTYNTDNAEIVTTLSTQPTDTGHQFFNQQ